MLHASTGGSLRTQVVHCAGAVFQSWTKHLLRTRPWPLGTMPRSLILDPSPIHYALLQKNAFCPHAPSRSVIIQVLLGDRTSTGRNILVCSTEAARKHLLQGMHLATEMALQSVSRPR